MACISPTTIRGVLVRSSSMQSMTQISCAVAHMGVRLSNYMYNSERTTVCNTSHPGTTKALTSSEAITVNSHSIPCDTCTWLRVSQGYKGYRVSQGVASSPVNVPPLCITQKEVMHLIPWHAFSYKASVSFLSTFLHCPMIASEVPESVGQCPGSPAQLMLCAK